jgi:hypothetical protein
MTISRTSLDGNNSDSFAEQALKKWRTLIYQDLSFITPISKHAERDFSAAKLGITD